MSGVRSINGRKPDPKRGIFMATISLSIAYAILTGMLLLLTFTSAAAAFKVLLLTTIVGVVSVICLMLLWIYFHENVRPETPFDNTCPDFYQTVLPTTGPGGNQGRACVRSHPDERTGPRFVGPGNSETKLTFESIKGGPSVPPAVLGGGYGTDFGCESIPMDAIRILEQDSTAANRPENYVRCKIRQGCGLAWSSLGCQ